MAGDHDCRADLLLGQAAACWNLGRWGEATEHIKRASTAVTDGGTMLGRLLHASWLVAIHMHLGDRAEADGWEAFLMSLPCPAETVECFRRRGRLLVRRSRSRGRVLVI